MASPSKASTASAVACCRKLSGSISSLLLLPVGAFRLRPVQRPLLPDIEESRKNQNHKDQHLHESCHPQIAEHHRPQIQENRLNIEEDEEHRHQVKFHAESLPRVPSRHNARFIRHIDRKSTRLNSSHLGISYAVFC